MVGVCIIVRMIIMLALGGCLRAARARFSGALSRAEAVRAALTMRNLVFTEKFVRKLHESHVPNHPLCSSHVPTAIRS